MFCFVLSFEHFFFHFFFVITGGNLDILIKFISSAAINFHRCKLSHGKFQFSRQQEQRERESGKLVKFLLMKHKTVFKSPGVNGISMNSLTFCSFDRNSHIGIADELHPLKQSATIANTAITFTFIFIFFLLF